jgi:cob(I)alamin adenosyltransferase
MVYLNRITTKTGDDGLTGLGDGRRVPKTDPRVRAYGAVDELNSAIGVCLAVGQPNDVAKQLVAIQNDLFDMGADLCLPEANGGDMTPLRVSPQQVKRLEGWIDAAASQQPPLESFVLPGGSLAAAHLHVARTVCRRAEIDVLALAAEQPINRQVQIYLNRLSDLLFIHARGVNAIQTGDVTWVPGQGRT